MRIWGILNLNDDSFYSGSRTSPASFETRLKDMLADGADVVDLGAESTRPYSKPVSPEEEWKRLEEPLAISKEILDDRFSEIISVDSYKDATIERAVKYGVKKINHIAGGSERVFDLAATENLELVLMHSFSNPEDMQTNPQYYNVVDDIYAYLENRTNCALNRGVSEDQIIWDFGIGFGKTTQHNIELLKNIEVFQNSGFRVMVGLSRKSFMGRQLNIEKPEERLVPTIIYQTILAFNGLRDEDILRVHDVREADYIRRIHESWEMKEPQWMS